MHPHFILVAPTCANLCSKCNLPCLCKPLPSLVCMGHVSYGVDLGSKCSPLPLQFKVLLSHFCYWQVFLNFPHLNAHPCWFWLKGCHQSNHSSLESFSISWVWPSSTPLDCLPRVEREKENKKKVRIAKFLFFVSNG
jgi:hypothetical protein